MDFSGEMLKTRRELNDMFKVVEEKSANQEYFIQRGRPEVTSR